MRHHRARVWLAVGAAAAVLAACGVTDDGEDAATTASAPPTTAAPTTTTTLPGKATLGPTRSAEDLWAGVDFGLLADLPAGDPVDEWADLVDDSGTLEVTVPAAWDDTDLTVGEADGVDVPSIFAAADLTSFSETYDDPGMKYLLYSHDIDDRAGVTATRRRLAAVEENCEESTDFDYDDGLYLGTAELWTGCGDAGAAYLLVVAAPEADDAAFELVLEVQMLTQADVEAARKAIETFLFTGSAEDVPVASDPADTTAPTEPPASVPDEEQPIGTADQAVALVTDHLQGCGMGWDWTSANEMGGDLWEVAVWIVPPGPIGENGDPGEGAYLVDVATGEVTSTNGTANVLCPG